MERLQAAMARGPHKSAIEHADFLREEFVDMINKDQWVVLPFEQVKLLPNLRVSPPGVIPQDGRRPRWIGDWSYYGVNDDTVPLAPQDAMQYGRALERYLRQIVVADQEKHGPVYQIKGDVSDGYYRVGMNPRHVPSMGLVFPSFDDGTWLVAFPLVLGMGWRDSAPYFCAFTETVADLANEALSPTSANHKWMSTPHEMDERAAEVEDRLQPPRSKQDAVPTTDVVTRNPGLRRARPKPAAYYDVFVDDFIALAQGSRSRLRKC